MRDVGHGRLSLEGGYGHDVYLLDAPFEDVREWKASEGKDVRSQYLTNRSMKLDYRASGIRMKLEGRDHLVGSQHRH